MSSTDTHVVLVRPLATDRWEILEYAKSAESALCKANKQRDDLSYGDLILAIDLAEISAIQERGKCLYFVNKTGEVTKAPKIPLVLSRPTWFLAWEGPSAMADDMLQACINVNRKLLLDVALSIARPMLKHLATIDDALINSLKETDAWRAGTASAADVHGAAEPIRAMRLSLDNPIEIFAADAIYCCAEIIYGASPHSDASEVAWKVCSAHTKNPDVYDEMARKMSHAVREYIPLHIMLESLA